ncbi:hypothetical protein AXXA_11990 [Achromobacter insuavis AXX-A]|uniref:Uncharacterized protein n=1 Tax=Achromobacter insuavis AXX-A TaxID=1003200 RepID=F7T0D6_9BURK|nr:hypothetical protein AXXA_11990 [Achromobacter insuavis AXX-A]
MPAGILHGVIRARPGAIMGDMVAGQGYRQMNAGHGLAAVTNATGPTLARRARGRGSRA